MSIWKKFRSKLPVSKQTLSGASVKVFHSNLMPRATKVSELFSLFFCLGAMQWLRGQNEGGGQGQKMSVFVHAQGIKIVHTGHNGRA